MSLPPQNSLPSSPIGTLSTQNAKYQPPVSVSVSSSPPSSSPSTSASKSISTNSTYLEDKTHRFMIMDAPTDSNLPGYVDMLVKKNVKYLVRACEPSYSVAALNKSGITVVEMPFPDGDPPSNEIVSKWLSLVNSEFKNPEEKRCIAVHCVAGLGRAPVLVAIALVESGMEPFDAINFIRKRRRGALNSRQLKYIESYKPRSASQCCLIC